MSRNVLVIVLDTARADAFEPYGAPGGSTPTVAQLASSGSARDHVFSTACWTLPSHASMFTGVMPRELGLGQAPGGTPAGVRPVLEANTDRLLPEVLRRAGWNTRGVSTNVWVSPHVGFDLGFDEFELVHAGAQQEHVGRDDLKGKVVWAYSGLRARQDDGASQAEETVSRWIDELDDQPFFWFVNLVECHSPYLPPKPYNDLGLLDRLKAADEARRHLSLDAIWRTCLGPFDVPDGALGRMRHLYDRSIRLMDDWLARVLERLDASGVLDDTLVLVTSDHGENFGEGGLLAHAFSLDDRLLRVPFVTNRPELAPGDGAASLVDLPRLLARYLDLDADPWGDSPLEPGLAAGQFDFIAEDDPRVQRASTLWNLDERGRSMLTDPLTCVTDGRQKLLRRGGTDEVYDLAEDPLELSSRPAGEDAANRELVDALANPSLWRVGAEPALAAASREDVEDLEARMKLLGYM
jgi:arylsulfatase A-like enzyme